MEEGETRSGAFRIANSWGVGGWENIDDGCYWISYEAMKQREGYCMFYHDTIGYDPRTIAMFRIDHAKRGECETTVGIGNRSSPIQTKRFDNWIRGGDHPFCPNNIALDITEFEEAVPTIIGQTFFIKIRDEGSHTEGTIQNFSITYYRNYTSGLINTTATSYDVPVSTINNIYVYADLLLSTGTRANALWIEPATVNLDGLENGYRFNLTAWVNLTQESYTWQAKIMFDNLCFNAAKVGYTAGRTSEFFAGHTTIPISPTINNEEGYVIHAESLLGADSRGPGLGSLMWVEFELQQIPSEILDINFSTLHDTFVLNENLEELSIDHIDGTKINPSPIWDVALTASLAGYYDVSDFGVRRDATEGFDVGYDVVDPPAPPIGVVSYFWYSDNPITPIDLRRLSVSKIPPIPPMTWPYKVEARGIEGIACITWDAEEIAMIPPEYDVLLCTLEECIDMRQVTQYCFHSESHTRYPYEVRTIISCDSELQLLTGWNMISFPCLPANTSWDNLLGDCGYYQVLTWDGRGYIAPPKPEFGGGYWVLVLEDCNITITNGLPCNQYERNLPKGWSIIGSIFPCTVNADCVFPDYYQLLTWDGSGYIDASTIEPGKGYWALVLEETHIVVDDSCCMTN